MKQRTLGRTGLRVSEVGLGCEHLQGKPLSLIQQVVDAALDGGINIFDVFMSEPEVRTNLGIALAGRRDKVVLQGHIGAGWRDGQYMRTRDLAECRHFFEDFMQRLQTDYVDIGMIHFVDTQEDYAKVVDSGLLALAAQYKQEGIIRAVGVSSHDPIVAKQLVETGVIDVLMFSLNPAFDMLPGDADLDSLFVKDSYAARETLSMMPERTALYQACEARDVAITVMKGLGGGLLLGEATTPLGAPLTVHQCMHYALTRPAVKSVLVGCQSAEQVQEALAYETAPDAARDYARVLAETPRFSMKGSCMYCNHCLPCPAQLDIAQVNKYLDLAEMGQGPQETVRAHYAALAHHASECIACGECEARCPFSVSVIQRMTAASDLFGL